MCESVGEFELVHASGLAQLDISPAQILVHIAAKEEESAAKGEFQEIGDFVFGIFFNP